MNRIFKYISASALLLASFVTVANAQYKLTDAESDKAQKSIELKKNTTPVDGVPGAYYLNLETFVTGYTSNVTTYETTTVSTPLDIVLLLDMSGSMDYNMAGNSTTNVADRRITILKSAVTDFISSINEDSKTNNVEHRISLIKFARQRYATGTTTSAKTTYYPMNSVAYSYNGYGSNTYYIKVGENYYQVYREKQDVDAYNALASTDYTPNMINDGEYYYKHTDGKYYKLSRGGLSNSYRTVEFTVNGITWYLHGTTAGTDRQTYDRKATAYTGVLYQKGTSSYYRLYYTVGSTKHYLSGTTETTTAPTNVTNGTTTIWTGSLYMAETATTPDNIIEGNELEENNSKNVTQVVKNFTAVDDTGSSTLLTALNSLKAGGATYADSGMELAKLVFSGARGDAIKVLILFTDGDPGYNSFESGVANSVIKSSKLLKDQGVTVYTIGTFSKPNTNQNNYMGNTSSNYPNATSLTDAGTRGAGDYYFNVTDASSLDSVFQRISQETSQEASNANAGYTEATTENNVTVKDIVTNNFVIPSDAEGNIDLTKIEIYTAKSTGVTRVDGFDYQNYEYTENGYSWADPVPSDLEPVAARDSETGKTTVSVPGFDFSANWVGWQDAYDVNGDTKTRKDADCSLHEGYKLIIKVLVEPDPNAVGGEVPTNDPASGLYITKNGTEVNLESYPIPDSVLVPMDLNIIMNGIKDRGDYNLYKEGETAIFKVTSYDGKTWRVAVTADENGTGTASIKVPFYNDETKDTYVVEEDSAWSYRFNSIADPEITGNPDGSVISKQLTVADHTYYFVATDTEERPNGDIVSEDFQKFFYDESNENNVFNSSANPTGTTTTSRKN